MGKLQHVVALALPAQGHLNALMRFCKLLVDHDEAFLVTFVDIDLIHNRVQNVHNGDGGDAQQPAGDGDQPASQEPEPRIRRAHVSVPGIDLSKDFNFSFRDLFEALRPMGPALIHLIRSLHPPVTCLLSDFTITVPTQDVADQLAIPRIVLYPFCASRFLLLHYAAQGELFSMDKVSRAFATASTGKEVFHTTLPGLPTLYNIDLPHFKHVKDDSLYVWNLSVQSLKICNTRAHTIVVNSFNELEASAFIALSKCCEVPIYGIGPWIETLHKECATNLWREDEACMTWLDQQPASSVLYVSFGSITVLSQAQFDEILDGLLSSEQHFLWAFRPGLVEDATCSSTPTYVMSKSHSKGFVVDWAPQVKVLAHPSIGGFLTHCGWNSVTESIAHGVPMLCWPYFADQPLNARCIVDEWKLGLRFEFSEGNASFIKRGEVERGVRLLMEGVEGRVARKNVTILKEACLERLLPNGSSYKNLKALIASLTLSHT
ncbi:hypothetical protein GOP47_0012522 [Adiantum capillus-veneris]|uniref:Glycosyltransferase n=1 Tax=Adiantum capillus-veneris TaxID=13818 RepID=A0A9D4ZGX1_ADICA|nr:hypothetical protein GOP47_0012522 [Adiantum capillus-veneris]